MTLQEIDKVSVTILMDNSTDLLLTNSIHANRPHLTTNEEFLFPLPIAEHGFSALVDIAVHGEKKEKNNMGKKIKYKNNNSIFLFDAGASEDGVIHNADIFGIDFDRIDGVILSHGHFDHFTGLANILRKISLSQRKSTDINLLAHPEAFLKRWEVFQDGKRVRMPFLDEEHLK